MPEPRPVIGISAGTSDMPIPEGKLHSTYVGRGYSEWAQAADGLPVVLPSPPEEHAELAERSLDAIDALLLSGGIDIAPSTYGAGWEPAQAPDLNRDLFETALIKGAVRRGMPVLGICRGMQMINVALGGTLFEDVVHADVAGVEEGGFSGVRRHELDLEPETLVRRAFDRERVEVFCLHHQSPDRIGEGLRVGARADDGIVESVEDAGGAPLLGVLWHPEQMRESATLQSRLFGWLVAAARGSEVEA